MSRFWNWLLSHLSSLLRLTDGRSMETRFRIRQRSQEEQLEDAKRRVEFLRDQTELRKGEPR